MTIQEKLEAMMHNRGVENVEELIKDNKRYSTKNMPETAAALKSAIAEKRHIFVVADYDADGVMSGCELYLILKELGADFTIRFPRKMSEGYGISMKILNEVPEKALILTIDNGIAAVDVVKEAKARGHQVIILDHHLVEPGSELPDADVIVDPHITKVDGEFEDYCGAGLGFVLARELHLSKETMYKCYVLASIATVQDVVPMLGDNRNIVRYGLQIVNKQLVKFDGIFGLLGELGLHPNADPLNAIKEDDIAFKIGPCVNAMGRMHDDGASECFERLMLYEKYGMDGIREIVEINNERKKITDTQQLAIDAEILAEGWNKKQKTCLVVYLSDLFEGVIGINAARVCEEYKRPVIVLTDAEDGMLKGSARSVEGVDIKSALDSVKQYLVAYGGHAGAAGVTVDPSKIELFTKAINEAITVVPPQKTLWTSELEISAEEVPAVYEELRKYAPFGEAFPNPVVRVNNYKLRINYGKRYRFIGDNGVSLNGNGSEAVSFELKKKYQELQCPTTLNIVGTLGWSSYSKQPQIIMSDFQAIKSIGKVEPLI